MDESRIAALEELSQRVEQLTRELSAVRADLAQLKKSEQPADPSISAAATAPTTPAVPRQLPPLSGASTDPTISKNPPVSATSDPQSKIELFLSRFIGRRDVYAQRWTSQKTGKSGWSPAVIGGFYSKDASSHAYLPLTPQVIEQHLRNGGLHAGLYVMLPGDMCQLLVCDFDDGTWKEDAAAFINTCKKHQVDALAEISRSGEGAHVWIFFDAPLPASTARALGFRMLRETMRQRPKLGLESYDRFFPSQDTLSTGARGQARLGNLIALPLNGQSRSGGTTVFADPSTWEPFPDQFAALASVPLVTRDTADSLVKTAESPFGPNPERIRRPERSELRKHRGVAKGKVIELHIDNVVHLPTLGLPGSVISELKHRASLPNPEFYRRQAQRFSTFGIPRVVIRFEHDDIELRLPRGLVDDVEEILEEAGFTIQISWPEITSEPTDLKFQGELRPHQDEAINHAAEHRFGVIVAPPGSGKTVMACALIAKRQLSTAIIVNRVELVNQWQERLSEFLSIPADGIGQWGSGKKKLTGVIDVITLQSINRKTSDPLILEDYDQLIIDECHNVAAPAAEGALNQVTVPYWVGLTATPFRSDKMDEIITMQCGPIRHRMDIDIESEERFVKIHHTDFATDAAAGERGAIQDIYNLLAEDKNRNLLITEQVVAATKDERNCLVLVNRITALNSLAELIRESTEVPVLMMFGNQKQSERAQLRAELEKLSSENKSFVLIAMGRVAGEGLDLPSLNTLFLAAPISFKGVVIQQTGRITRNTGREEETVLPAVVHDFVDTQVPVLARMHGRRLRAMKKEGFKVLA